MDVDAVNSLSSGKGAGSLSPRDGCLKCGGAHFQRDCNARKNTGKQPSGKGKQSKSWSKKVRVKITRENPKEPKVRTQDAKGSHKGKTSKTCLSGFENSKSEASSETQESAQICPTDTFWNDGWNCDEWNDGWSFDEWNDDWSTVGWHEGWEQTGDNPASSVSLGGLDLGATSSPKWLQWVKINLCAGAVVITLPLNFGPD